MPGPLTPFPQHDVFILSASLFTVEAAECRKEELYQPAEILILLTSILELQQLQPALEALLGRLWGGLCWAAGAQQGCCAGLRPLVPSSFRPPKYPGISSVLSPSGCDAEPAAAMACGVNQHERSVTEVGIPGP